MRANFRLADDDFLEGGGGGWTSDQPKREVRRDAVDSKGAGVWAVSSVADKGKALFWSGTEDTVCTNRWV